MLAANLINYGTNKIQGGWGWLASLALAAVPAGIIIVGALGLPDTPNSLIERGHMEKGRAMLERIRELTICRQSSTISLKPMKCRKA